MGCLSDMNQNDSFGAYDESDEFILCKNHQLDFSNSIVAYNLN